MGDICLADAQDPDASYVTRWVPELARLPRKWVRTPWAAPAAVLEAAGVALGETYPHRITTGDLRVRLLLAPLPRRACKGRRLLVGASCHRLQTRLDPHCIVICDMELSSVQF